MVSRPANLYKTPPGSRGNSPARALNRSTRSSPAQSPIKNGIKAASKKNIPSPDGRRKNSQDRLIVRSRGNSPAKSNEDLPRSRGSE